MKLALAWLASTSVLFRPALPREDSIVFAVAEAASVRKTFDFSLELKMDDVTMTLGEQELPENVTDAFEFFASRADACVVTDEYRSVADGRPVELVRRFETLERHEVKRGSQPGSEPVDEDETKESELAGHALRFAWNDESESYDVTWVGEAGDDELLEGLEEDMDLRAFLPEAPVSVDDTWELECKAVLAAIPPGGRLGFPKDEEDDDFDFEETFEGTAEATYAGTLEEDGVRLAVITVKLEGEAEKPAEERDGGTQSATFALDVEYELLWDLDGGHAHSIEVVGGIGAVMSISQEVEVQGQSLPLEAEIEFSGSVEMGGVFERQ